MRVEGMRVQGAARPDLVDHVVRHFLSPRERSEWDRLPAGTARAEELCCRIPRGDGKPPALSELKPVDLRWWRNPWLVFAVEAHDEGYAPRYRLLIARLGTVGTGRWERQQVDRWCGEIAGFKVVVAGSSERVSVVTAYFSGIFRHDDRPGAPLASFREFASRHCPPGSSTGVPGSRTQP